MAVLRQQKSFVGELFETGMVDEGEHHSLLSPIDKKTRHLEIVGPVWRPSAPRQVLRGLPFMGAISEQSFKRLWDSGEMHEFRSGQCIWTASNLVRQTNGYQGPGGFVVLSGVVKRVYIRPDGIRKEYFQSAGGVVGVLLCMTGTKLPGTEMAIAEGNTLGKGPLVFHVPQSFVKQIQQLSLEGNEDMAIIERELLRLSAAYVVESLEPDIVNAVTAHMSAVMNPSDVTQPQPTTEGDIKTGTGNESLLRRSSSLLLGGQGAPQPQSGAGGERRTTNNSTTLPSPGFGLQPSKSVGANLASMMQHIAHLEYSDDDEAEGDNAVEANPVETTGQTRRRPSLEERRSVETQADVALGDAGQPRAVSEQQRNGALSPPSPHKRTVKFQAESSKSLNTQRAAFAIAAAIQHAPQVAADVAFEIKRGLHSAFVLHLASGSRYVQSSHTVLLAGKLSPIIAPEASNASADSQRTTGAPAILPWLWHGGQLCNLGACVCMREKLEWTVGEEVAILVVCHQLDGSVPPAVIDWQAKWKEVDGRLRAHSELASFPLGASQISGRDFDDVPPRGTSTASESEQGSLMGAAAASVGREFGSMLSRLRRTRPTG